MRMLLQQSLLHHCGCGVFIALCLLFILVSQPCESKQLIAQYPIVSHNQELWMFYVHEPTGNVYVGGTNYIYKLSNRLQEIEKIATGPQEDSVWCQAPNDDDRGECECPGGVENCRVQTDVIPKILTLESTYNNIIVCSNIYQGACEKRPISRLQDAEQLYQQVVPIARDVEVVVFEGMGPADRSTLYVAASTDYSDGLPIRLPLISSRNVQSMDLEGDNLHKYIRDAYRSDQFKSYYKGGFTYDGNAYFFSARDHLTNSGVQSVISRVCEMDNEYRTYVEIPLSCNVAGRSYNLMTSITLGQVGKNLADSLQISSGIRVVFATFAMSSQNSNVGKFTPTTETAVCIYPMDYIISQFESAYDKCLQGRSSVMRGPDYILPSGACRKQLIPGDKDYCHPHSGITSIFASQEEIINRGRYRFTDVSEVFTAQQIVTIGGETILFLGTKSGKLLKVLLHSTVRATVYDTMIVESNQPIRQLHTLVQAQEMYALTANKMHLIKLVNCSKLLTCESCQEDPFCGWCVKDKRCTEQTSCMNSLPYLGWLQKDMQQRTCPEIENVAPRIIPAYDARQVTFNIDVSYLPTVNGAHSLSCHIHYRGHERTATIQSYVGQHVVCDPFNNFFALPNDEATMNITLTLLVSGEHYLSTTVTQYDCTRLQKCTGCTGTQYPCAWCLEEGRCEYETNINHQHAECSDAVYGLNADILGTVNAIRLSNGVGPMSCPRIVSNQGNTTSEILVASGTNKEVVFRAYNLQTFQIGNLQCEFAINPPHSVPASTVVHQSPVRYYEITCAATTLSYNEDEAFKSIPLSLKIEEDIYVDNPTSLKVQLYKCEYLVDNCGNCLTLDTQYQCGWCGHYCSLYDNCAAGWMPPQQLCANPEIRMLTPTSGPIQGGTLVTVEGINLGRNIDDLQGFVKVATLNCAVQREGFVPSNKFVCRTSASTKKRSGSVQAAIADTHTALSEQEFSYEIPRVTTMWPRRGPQSGGTYVYIGGDDLHIGDNVTILINGEPTSVIMRNSSHLYFYTTPQLQTHNAVVKLNIDHGSYNAPDFFVYTRDPEILSVSPINHLVSGGTTITVTGTKFLTVEEPQFVVHYQGERISESCIALNATVMHCTVPSLASYSLTTSLTEPMSVNYGFIMDGVQALTQISDMSTPNINPLVILPDPVFYMLGSEDNGYVETYEKNMRLLIVGDNLDVIRLIPDTLEITVAGELCNYTDDQITGNEIRCNPPVDPAERDNKGKADVMVTMGYYTQNVGYLQYPYATKSELPLYIGIIVGVLLGVIAAFLIIFCCIRRCIRRKKAKRRLKNVAPDIFQYQAGRERASNRYEGSEPLHDTYHGGGACGGEEMRTNEEGVLLIKGDPMDYITDAKLKKNMVDVLIHKDRITLGEILGRGHYGCVYAGKMSDAENDDEIPMDVAVKTLQGTKCDQDSIELFLKEGIMMKNFKHPHVLQLMGVCLAEGQFPMVILPYMKDGDLRTYVKDKSRNFTARQLLHLCQQVAEGMTYLASLNFVHRDLAARNCMVDENKIVKVADFGLSQDLYEKDYYHSSERKRKLPIKWMALESLEDYIFTLKTDVWSFGVLMWELLTRGITPYPDVDVFEIRNYLASGRRLRQPKYCPDNVYQIMMSCWEVNPKERPAFGDLVNCLELVLNPPKQRQPKSEEEEPLYENLDKSESLEYLEPAEQKAKVTIAPKKPRTAPKPKQQLLMTSNGEPNGEVTGDPEA